MSPQGTCSTNAPKSLAVKSLPKIKDLVKGLNKNLPKNLRGSASVLEHFSERPREVI